MGLGCWAIGGIARLPVHNGSGHFGWGKVDDNESIRAIHTALDLGINFFDTADVYGTGHSELVLGKALAGRRDKGVIATKFGIEFDENARRMTGYNASAEYIRRACEGSLQRLNIDYIDLYQFHLGEYDSDYVDDICDMLDRLAIAGKIRYYGWSTDDPKRAKVFSKRKGCTAVQHQLNVLEDAPDMLSLCEEKNLASINRGPLAMGLLTGKIVTETKFSQDDFRCRWDLTHGPGANQLRQLGTLREVLTVDGRTLTQAALGWLWARNERTIPIPGFKTSKQVEENAAAMQFGPLTTGQMSLIDTLLGRSEERNDV
jgi:aryl-alcohol dehydrogenase-like predicted oxidoreductase